MGHRSRKAQQRHHCKEVYQGFSLPFSQNYVVLPLHNYATFNTKHKTEATIAIKEEEEEDKNEGNNINNFS